MTEPTTELPPLESLDDATLQEVMRRARELLQERERTRQQDAIERARAILSEAGVSVQALLDETGRGTTAGRGARKAGGGSTATGSSPELPRKGARYANPADPSQIHVRGRGREPNWFKALRERGEMPEPLE
jgi:hypothetical protein